MSDMHAALPAPSIFHLASFQSASLLAFPRACAASRIRHRRLDVFYSRCKQSVLPHPGSRIASRHTTHSTPTPNVIFILFLALCSYAIERERNPSFLTAGSIYGQTLNLQNLFTALASGARSYRHHGAAQPRHRHHHHCPLRCARRCGIRHLEDCAHGQEGPQRHVVERQQQQRLEGHCGLTLATTLPEGLRALALAEKSIYPGALCLKGPVRGGDDTSDFT